MMPDALARRQAIVAQLTQGKTYQEVATMFGVSRQRIAQIARKAGLPKRRTGRRAKTP